MASVIRFTRRCHQCRRQYRRQHTCFGRGHRSADSHDRQALPVSVDPRRQKSSRDETAAPRHLSPYTAQQSLSRPDPSNECTTNPGRCLHFYAPAVRQRSIAQRLGGDIEGSVNEIRLFLRDVAATSDITANECLASLYLSQAANYICHFDFPQAHREIQRWMPRNLAGYENLIWDQVFCIGRILRGEGNFEEAKVCFERCLETPSLRRPKRLLVKSALADVYCELDCARDQLYHGLSRAQAMLESEIEQLRLSDGHHLKGYRRLLLSLAEVNLKQGHLHKVDLIVRELLAIYPSLSELDIVDRLGHVRALICFARISPTSEVAVDRWNDVLGQNRLYNPFEEEVFTCGVVHLCLSRAWDMAGNTYTSMECFYAALDVLWRKPRQFLIPGLGTYIFHDVWDQVQCTSWWTTAL